MVVAADTRTSPASKGCGPRQVLGLHKIRLLLDEGVAVLGEAAGGGIEQALVPGRLGEEALDGLKAKGDGLADELGIVIRRIGRSPGGEGVTEGVHSQLADARAAGPSHHPEHENDQASRSHGSHKPCCTPILPSGIGGIFSSQSGLGSLKARPAGQPAAGIEKGVE